MKMSKSDENTTHVYTINLGKAWLTPQYRRTDRVINMIKEFAKRHMKNENIKIDQELEIHNNFINKHNNNNRMAHFNSHNHNLYINLRLLELTSKKGNK